MCGARVCNGVVPCAPVFASANHIKSMMSPLGESPSAMPYSVSLEPDAPILVDGLEAPVCEPSFMKLPAVSSPEASEGAGRAASDVASPVASAARRLQPNEVVCGAGVGTSEITAGYTSASIAVSCE